LKRPERRSRGSEAGSIGRRSTPAPAFGASRFAAARGATPSGSTASAGRVSAFIETDPTNPPVRSGFFAPDHDRPVSSFAIGYLRTPEAPGSYPMDDPNYLTPPGYERLVRELEWLDHVERPRVTAEVSYAASLGDRSENAEYIYGKKRLREIDARRRFLVKRLEKARVVDPAVITGDVVRFGAIVVLADQTGAERTWRIYGEDEVNVDAGVLSWRSPIAKAILGKREGDSVRYEAPAGVREVEIVEVRYEPAPPLPADLDFSR
jgi:transcription elongation factor GreB